MAFGFSQSPWQQGAASPQTVPWQAGTQSPWRQGPAALSPMSPGAGLAPIYRPSEFAGVTPETAQDAPAQMPFGGFMPMPMPMPFPMPMPMYGGGSQTDFVNVPGQGMMPSSQAYMGAYGPMNLMGATAYGPYLDMGQAGFGRFY